MSTECRKDRQGATCRFAVDKKYLQVQRHKRSVHGVYIEPKDNDNIKHYPTGLIGKVAV
jgi:hypothetical protein